MSLGVRVPPLPHKELSYSWCVRPPEERKDEVRFLKAPHNELVAQLVEHYTFNVGVLGSIPNGFTIRNIEESGLSRFVWDEEHAGSNPAIPTHW